MEPYKMEVWSYEEGKRKVPTIIDTRTQMVVCQMQCDEGRDNPYTFPLSEAESRANEIVMLLNRKATSLGEIGNGRRNHQQTEVSGIHHGTA